VYREGTAVMHCGLGNLLIVNILLTTRKLLHAGDVKVKTNIRYDVLCGITNATTLDALKSNFRVVCLTRMPTRYVERPTEQTFTSDIAVFSLGS